MKILTAYGELDRSLVVRDRVLLDNDNERTLNLEYRLKQPLRMPDGRVVLPDEIIKRSAHVRLKAWPRGMDAEMGSLITASFPVRNRQRGGSFTPTGTPPGDFQRSFLRHLGHMFRFANSAGMCTSFKKEILCGSHAFGTQAANGVRTVTTKDSFKLALFLVSASRSPSDTAYSTTGELAGTGGYTQGGVTLTNGTDPTTSGTTAFWTPTASAQWTSFTSSGAFDAAVLWNDTSTGDLQVSVHTFSSQSVTSGTFTLTMPTNDATNGLIRIA